MNIRSRWVSGGSDRAGASGGIGGAGASLARTGLVIASAAGLMFTAACGASDSGAGSDSSADSSAGETTVKISLTTTTDEPLWELVNKNLEEAGAGITIETVPMKSAVLGNQALAAGDVDLSAQQHYAFLNGEIQEKNYDFTVIGETYISPFNIYSNKIKDVSELKDGDKFLIPNDPTNGGRALIVMEQAGIITIDPAKNDPANGVYPAEEDITANPKNIEIVPSDRNIIMNSLDDAAAGIANANAVVDFGKSVDDDSIFKLDPDPKLDVNKPWINVIVARTEDKDSETYKKIVEAYHQDNVRDLMNNESKGAEIPTW